jgi:hypothetical protein
VELEEIGKDPAQVQHAEGHRRTHEEPAARRGLEARHGRLRFLDPFQRGTALLEERGAGLRQRQPPGGAVEQARAEPLLQAREVLAHDGPGKLQVVGGAREAAAFHHAHEDGDVGQVVHGRASDWSIFVNNNIAFGPSIPAAAFARIRSTRIPR